MGLDNKYFSYCKEIGLMKENYTKERALETLKKAVKDTYEADPAFVERVSKLTLNSKEVSTRSCVLYRYNINLEYVVGGVIKRTTINEFGQSGVHESLHITDYQGEGNYTILKDASQIPYSSYNDKNLFTYEEMKKALTNLIEKKLPSNCTYFESKGWDISAYIVPVLVVIMEYNGKTYYLYYNLQNGYYHWEWPIDPAMLKSGKKAHKLAKLFRFVAVAVAILAVIVGFSMSNSIQAVIAIIITIVNIILIKNKCKSLGYYEKVYRKDRNKNKFALVILEYVMMGLSLLALILCLA